jgi:hypothetical protein
MPDWTALSEDERKDIEDKLREALNSIGIKGAMTRWNKSPVLHHWQLVIETLWCANKTRTAIIRSLEQAMARTDIQAPKNGVILRSHKEK